MSERTFRLILGFTLWGLLVYSAYFQTMWPIYAFCIYLVFEGITNLRFTLLVSRLKTGSTFSETEPSTCTSRIINRIDSERVLRIIIAALIIISFNFTPDLIWFLPWFISGMLIMAGITNICPMAMFLKWSGMR